MIDKPSGAVLPASAPEPDPLAFLSGGGEMGALIRAHDWSDSPLGPPAHWSAPLRTTVRLMLNSGHPMYIWWGAQRACLYNDAYRESIGPERHPGSLGRPAHEVWGEIRDIIDPQIEQVMSGRGATWNVDHLVPITRHGRREDVYWTYSYSPIDDETAPGGIGGVLVVCTETTARVLAAQRLAAERDQYAEHARVEASLRDSEARFRAALNAGRMGSWETDHATRTRQWSEEGMALFGLDLPGGRGQVGGDNDEYVRAIHPDDRHLVQRFRELAAQQDSFPAEYRVVRPDGSTLWLLGRGMVVERDEQGRPLRLVSIMADVTERKQAEAHLLVERERLGLALSAGQMGAYDLNLRDGVLWWSPETYALFGVDPGNFVPTPASVIALLHPDDRDTFLRLRGEAIDHRRPFDHEFRIVRPDGSVAWIAHRGQAEYDLDGRPVRNFGVSMDITKRKEVEAVLRDADHKKDDFIAMLAHELRNPLAPIRNAVHMLRQKGAVDSTGAWCHDVIDRQVSQMARLLDDLLDVSRLSSGKLKLRPEPIDIATAIERAVEIAQPLIAAGGHRFDVTLPASPLTVQGDLTRLAQVFSNILINAAKYTPKNGEIALHAEGQGDRVVVRIADSGIGIAAENLSKIFEMFGQVGSALDRSQGGQGIGLSLAKGLVEMHGGTILARSAGLGQGSELEVRLPVLQAGAAPGAPVAAAPVPAGEARVFRILIADDLRDASDSLALLLKELGHVVTVAYDGEQALAQAQAFMPQVALLDLGMPGLDGFAVCRRIRAESWGAGMVLVAQSGWGQGHDRRRSSEAGFDHHLLKPIAPGALVALLQNLGVGRLHGEARG